MPGWRLCALLLLAAAAQPAPDNPWERASDPTPPPAASLGSYSRGCLRGAVRLPESGPGYEVMRLSRKRFYGHPRLLEFIRSLARKTAANPRLGKLLVGDLGQARGGPTRGGHASHTNGLDVDLWFRLLPADAPVSARAREKWESPEMVAPVFRRLNKRWDPRVIRLLRLAAEEPAVERIFVNPVIKREICRRRGKEGWVAKLRPWFGHDDHFHVRLACAPGDAGCLPQTDPFPPDNGCGDDLSQWFTEEMRRKALEPPKPWSMPDLPEECADVIAEGTR
ncbi:MAG: penicillin-insensitive murein endopeptidase [Elusimicrobia bacterium]|nr:penicillin-insensitive murein endopeptidase [Elusimicrobiota bacterium]